jgi:glycosyltransferase involved in cell wall biosynthesis
VKRLLLVYLYCNLGGVTSVLKQRMLALRRQGWAVDAVFRADYGGASDLRSAGVDEVLIARRKFVKATTKQLPKGSYDAVTIVDTPELIRPVRERFAGQLIYEIHTPIARVLQMNRAEDLRKCDVILVPSAWSKRWVLAHFPSLDPDLVCVCPNIVSDRDFGPGGVDAGIGGHKGFPEILWVGKLAPYKNWREAVRIAGVLAAGRGVTFTMVTGGSVDQKRAEELLTELLAAGITDRARWLHNLPLAAMADLYRQAARSGGVLLSTSLSESFCLVIHEALRCGLPVVATRVGACPEIVRHETSGLLYEPGEEVVAAGQLERLLADRELRANLAAGAAAALRDFEEAALASRYMSLLEDPPRSVAA